MLVLNFQETSHLSTVGNLHEKEGHGKGGLDNLTTSTFVGINRVPADVGIFTTCSEEAAVPDSSHGYQPENCKEGIGDRDSQRKQQV